MSVTNEENSKWKLNPSESVEKAGPISAIAGVGTADETGIDCNKRLRHLSSTKLEFC